VLLVIVGTSFFRLNVVAGCFSHLNEFCLWRLRIVYKYTFQFAAPYTCTLYIIHYTPTQRHMASDFLFVIAPMFPPRIHLIFLPLFWGVLFRTLFFFGFLIFFFGIHGACIILACRSCQQCCHCSCYWHSNEYVNVASRRLFSLNRNNKQWQWSRFARCKSQQVARF